MRRNDYKLRFLDLRVQFAARPMCRAVAASLISRLTIACVRTNCSSRSLRSTPSRAPLVARASAFARVGRRPAPTWNVVARASAFATSSTAEMDFLSESYFDAMREAMTLYDEQRDTVIKRSRDITKAAKVAIYCLHRGEMDKARAQIELSASIADELRPIVDANAGLRGGYYSGGLEEYAEAVVFEHFVHTGTIATSADLPRCNHDEYLCGVLDFTGELNRYCISKATVRDVAEVRKCRDVVDALMGIFLKFDFRNGALRKKYDALKYTLKKMENTLYELSLSDAAKRAREDDDVEGDGKRAKGDGEDE